MILVPFFDISIAWDRNELLSSSDKKFKIENMYSLTVPILEEGPSCSQPKSPTMNFMILYHLYGSKECLCKIFQIFIHGNTLIFVLKVWAFSKKFEEALEGEGNRTRLICVTDECHNHYTNQRLMKTHSIFYE